MSKPDHTQAVDKLEKAIANEPSDNLREILIAAQTAHLSSELSSYQLEQILITLGHKRPLEISSCDNDCPACEYDLH